MQAEGIPEFEAYLNAPQEVAIYARDVTLPYHNNVPVFNVLNGLSLDAPRGSIYAILGPSGCGKSSLIRCILGMHNLTSGSISVFGQLPHSARLLGSTIGYLPQNIHLSPGFIRETLSNYGTRYGLSDIQFEERFLFLVQLFDLPLTGQLIDIPPQIGQMCCQQQRRVSLAIALIHRPSLLVLEEPTAGMSPLMRTAFWEYLIRLCDEDNVTVLITTQYIDEAEMANQIGVMFRGRILAQDSPAALLTRHQMATLEQVCLHLYTEAVATLPDPTVVWFVNFLPELCLEMVFSRVPIRELLLVVPLVCRNWLMLQRKTARKVRQLTLLVAGSIPDFTSPVHPQARRVLNDDGTFMYAQPGLHSFDSIHIDSLGRNALILVRVTFPNLTTLKVAIRIRSIQHLEFNVLSLLLQYHSKLVSLKLRIDSRVECNRMMRLARTFACPHLLTLINSMPSLRHLSLLFVNFSFSTFGRDVQLEFPILARLASFYFNSQDDSDVLLNTIRTNAVPNAMLRLSYHCSNLTRQDAQLEDYYQFGPRFCGQFGRIDNVDLMPGGELERFCSHFNAITSLDLTTQPVEQSPIESLFRCLSQLNQLIHLQLTMNFQFNDEDDSEDALCRLPSVKTLGLVVSNLMNHNDLSLLNIPYTMPHLQAVDAFIVVAEQGNRQCGLCEYNEQEEDGQLVAREEMLLCLSHAMMPLADCSALHHISVIVCVDEDKDDIDFQNLTTEDLKQQLTLN